MVQSVFGVGMLFVMPTVANPTPVVFGALQDVSVDIGYDLKKLYGSFQFPIEQARAKGTIDIKAAIGRFDPLFFNQVVLGMSSSTGEFLNALRETATIPGTPFQITVANGANFRVNLGVYNVNTGLWMTRVASAPATGQYSVNTGTGQYTFAVADVGNVVQFFYTYASASTGKTLTYTNQLMGATPTFGLNLVNSFNGKSLNLTFTSVVAPKLALPMKLDDFSLPAIDMSAGDDGSGNIFTMSLTG